MNAERNHLRRIEPWTPGEIETALRREWWINHGHGYLALYGDDGEMQCAACLADFKRQPLEELWPLVILRRQQRAASQIADAAVLAGREKSV